MPDDFLGDVPSWFDEAPPFAVSEYGWQVDRPANTEIAEPPDSARSSTPPIEITTFTKSGGGLSKRISLTTDGKLLSDGSACVMTRGTAKRTIFANLRAFAEHITALTAEQAIALGTLSADLPADVRITTALRLGAANGSAPVDLIARTAGAIVYKPDQPALALIDFDVKGIPDAVSARIKAAGGVAGALELVLPELGRVARVTRHSTSAGLARSDTGEPVAGSSGMHVYVLIRDGGDVERFLRVLHDRCWLKGFGWAMVGAAGQLLERSLIDRMVYAPERLVFEGAPELVPPLTQALREAAVIDGEALDSREACRDLSTVEAARLRDLRGAERSRLKPEADKTRAEFCRCHATRIVERTGCSMEAARRTVEKWAAGVLLPGVALSFDDDELAGCTVGDVMSEPERFVGATLADPLEGIEYGRTKAKVMRRPDGQLWIHTFAHGGGGYELRWDASAVEAAITSCEPANAADRLVEMLLAADVAPDEEQRIRAQVAGLSGVQVRPLAARIKDARAKQAKTQAAAEKERKASHRRDSRLRFPVPAPDGERLPVLRLIDEALIAVSDIEPPMRDLDGHPVEIRERTPPQPS